MRNFFKKMYIHLVGIFFVIALCCDIKKKFFFATFLCWQNWNKRVCLTLDNMKKEGFFWIHAITNIAFSINLICVVLRGTHSWISTGCAKIWLYSIKNTTTEFTNLNFVRVKNFDNMQKYLLHKLQKKTMHFARQSLWRIWNLSKHLHKRQNT